MEWSGKLPAAVGIPFLLACGIAYHASAEVVDITVTDKAAGFDLPTSDGGSPQVLFLVFTDRGVFNVGWEPL